jgi:hypothetical protein
MLSRVFLLVLWMLPFFCYAQKKTRSNNQTTPTSSVEPYYPEEGQYVPSSKNSKRRAGVLTRNAQKNFNDQRQQVAKQKRRAERILEIPDRAGTRYFGHKRTPKKRPPAKMKFCKVCGIRH